MFAHLNPNFWLCLCPGSANVHNRMEPLCNKCLGVPTEDNSPTQQQVNDHADYVQAQQAKARNQKHELPQQRKKPLPTREEFEAALDWLEANPRNWSNRIERDDWEMIVKRYKALV